MAIRLLKIAVIYFLIGIGLGMFMSITHHHQFSSVHAHINLLGWVSLALIGIFYVLFPSAAKTRLAKYHFWLHNIGLPIMMVGLILLMSGYEAIEPMLAVGGIILTLGVIFFAVNVFAHIKNEPSS